MNKNSGQIIVFALLIVLLGLTVGLSVTSRTIQDLKQSAVTDQSSRAFTAAEAGIEKALSEINNIADGSPRTLSLPGLNSVTYTVSRSTSGVFTPTSPVAKDDVISLDITSYTGPLYVCWGNNSQTAGLEISLYIKDSASNYSIKKTAYNPPSGCPSDCSSNNLTSAGSGSSIAQCGSSFISAVDLSSTFSLSNTNPKQLLRLRPFYGDASIQIAGNNSLPSPNYTVNAVAQTTGGVSRAVEVQKVTTGLAPIFDYVLFSNGNISQ